MKLIKGKFNIGASDISLLEIYKLVKTDIKIVLSQKSIDKIINSRKYLKNRIHKTNDLIYGVNTGFGSLCNHKIDASEIEMLQRNLVKSHNAGTGDVVPELIIKIMLLLKIRSLSFGYSANTFFS